MLKSYKYRLYPNDVQQEQLAKSFGCARFVYNLGLETKISAWKSAKKYINTFYLSSQMNELKDTDAAINIKNFVLRNHPIASKHGALARA